MAGLKKKNIFELIFLVTIIMMILIGIEMRNNVIQPQNQFGIVDTDLFCLSHSYNINGIEGFEKKEFTSKEKQQLLGFIASLDNEEVLKTDFEEALYGIPEMLTVSDQDYKVVFYLNSISNIEVKQFDRDGKLLNRKRYTTTTTHMKRVYNLLGLHDKEPF